MKAKYNNNYIQVEGTPEEIYQLLEKMGYRSSNLPVYIIGDSFRGLSENETYTVTISDEVTTWDWIKTLGSTSTASPQLSQSFTSTEHTELVSGSATSGLWRGRS